MLEGKKLRSLISGALKNTMEPTLAIKYLIFSQFCTEVKPDHLLPVDMLEGVSHYFFPNLVSALRPPDLLSEDYSYTHLYTWCLKTDHQFFTPRFLHTLFIQLVKCGEDALSKECRVWKNGLLLVHSDGTRSIIEVTDQTTRVYLAIQCIEGCESHLLKRRSVLTSRIKSLAHKACPAVVAEEFLLPPLSSYPPSEDVPEVPIAKVATSVIKDYTAVSIKTDTPQHVTVKDLLYFDPFHQIKEKDLQDIFMHSQCSDEVPPLTMQKLSDALKECSKLLRIEIDSPGVTYRQLHCELSQYSLFHTVENLYVS
jgi:hypothetical protein